MRRKKGYFGRFGGMFVPETLVPILEELEEAYFHAKKDKKFTEEYKHYLEKYAGRPTPLYFAERLTNRNEEFLPVGARAVSHRYQRNRAALGRALLLIFTGRRLASLREVNFREALHPPAFALRLDRVAPLDHYTSATCSTEFRIPSGLYSC